MMFFTWGSSCTPRCTAWAMTLVVMLTDTLSTPATPLAAGYQAAAQLGHQALGGVAQFHVKRHVATADLHVAQGAGADKILARVGSSTLESAAKGLVR